ncbi:MAG: transporter substrate-binding domain-containing protein [Bacteroidales bacterium]|nr:transporter substrate-binding domain-containing protein [Bacteroidales bacterium]
MKIQVNKLNSMILVLLLTFSCVRVGDPVPKAAEKPRLKSIMESGILRVVTDFNSSSYFIYRGQPMGYQYEMLQELSDYLGVKLEVSVNNDLQEKIEMLNSNKVDLVAVNLTVTKERREEVEFTVPHAQTCQVLVQRKPDNWDRLSNRSLEDSLLRNQLDLAEKTVWVQKNSAYAERLANLSDEIGYPIHIRETDDGVEDLIAKVASGEIEFTVCDEITAQINESYYNNLDIATPVSFPQSLAWALPKGATDLKEAIDTWLTDFKKTSKYASIHRKYFESKKSAERLDSDFFTNISGKISPYDAMIKEFSKEIGWDWRLVASMIYQESRFNPQATSWAGAYGLMQLMPATGKRFGVSPQSPAKMQIKAGLNFISWLNDRFLDIQDQDERKKFILAGYNVGLGHVLDARALALKHGKNPNVWDDHVAEFILLKSDPRYYNDPVVKYGYCRGTETYKYVADIMDRYTHYQNLIP